MPDRDEILAALAHVIDPELRKPVTELDMVRDVTVDGADVTVTIALTVAGCPLRSSFAEQVDRHVGAVAGVQSVELRFDVMSAEEKTALDHPPSRRTCRARDLAPTGDARPRRRLRQGRRRQVDAVGEPGGRARVARRAGRCARRGRLRSLDPAHAGRHPPPRRRRHDDHPARQRRSEADVDRAVPRREQPRHVARADAAQGARAVSQRRPLG